MSAAHASRRFHVFVCVRVPCDREPMGVEPRLLSVPELSHHLAESYLTCRLYLQETLQYKRQHHGKVPLLAQGG